MDTIEIFKEMRDICDDVVKAYESEDEKNIETALGKFLVFMVKLECLK